MGKTMVFELLRKGEVIKRITLTEKQHGNVYYLCVLEPHGYQYMQVADYEYGSKLEALSKYHTIIAQSLSFLASRGKDKDIQTAYEFIG